MSLLDRVKHLLRMCGHAFTITVHDRLDNIERELQATRVELQAAKLMETDAALLAASIHIIENLHALAGRTVVDTSGVCTTPEAGLLEFLYSHVADRTAIEIDSHNSEITAGLVRAGYDVHALNGHRPGVPIGLITLGCDPLAALHEMGERRASVIAADLTNGFEGLVTEMRRREYHWHLMLYRTHNGSPDSGPELAGTSYLSNQARALPDSQGSVFFFHEYRVFAEAQAWCAATLPRTWIKPPQA